MGTRLLPLCAAVFAAGLLFPSKAHACSCVTGAPLCQTFWETPLVVSGTVLEIEDAPGKDDRARQFLQGRIVRLRVTHAWRGEASGIIEINTGRGGGDCGYRFVKGEDYLVYANGSPGRYTTGICNRTRRLSEAAEDLAYFATALQPSAAGRIFGTVMYRRLGNDTSDRPIAGYTVTLSRADKQWTAVTDRDGRYQFRDMPAGEYAVTLAVADNETALGPSSATLADPRGCAAADFWVERKDGARALRFAGR